MREMSLRRALGAGTRILLGQLALESLLLGLLGGLVGLGLAHVSLAGFGRWIGELPRGEAITVDLRVLAFSILLAGAIGVAFGLLPALKTIGRDLDLGQQLHESDSASTEGRTTRWIRGGFIVGEVGISLVLVAFAGLLLQSFLAVTARDPGLDPQNVWVTRPNSQGIDETEEYVSRMERVRIALEALPDVEFATYGAEMPFEHVGGGARCCWGQLTARDEGGEEIWTEIHPVAEDFFATFRTKLLAGSVWDREIAALEPRPVVGNEELAIRLFGSAATAVGREVTSGRERVRISGVAEPTLHYGLDQPVREALYVPVEAVPFPLSATFAMRITGTGDGFAARVREAVWSVEPDLPVPNVVPLSTWIDDSSGMRRLESSLSGTFGAIALLLAASGLYGTLLYTASQRRRELGIRMALGASRRRIQSDVLGRGLLLSGVGVALGVPSALLLGRLVQSWLWEVSPSDPATLTGASIILLTTAAVASWLPAYRASRTDPVEVLRAD